MKVKEMGVYVLYVHISLNCSVVVHIITLLVQQSKESLMMSHVLEGRKMAFHNFHPFATQRKEFPTPWLSLAY